MTQDFIFFDFEFDFDAQSNSVNLISFGAVGISEGDNELPLYVEFQHPKKGFTSPFVVDTVIPLLTHIPVDRKNLKQFKTVLAAYSDLYSSPTFICDSPRDKELLQSILQGADIESIEFSDFLESNAYEESYESFFDVVLRPRHHALNDAKAIRSGWLSMMRVREAVNVTRKPDAR